MAQQKIRKSNLKEKLTVAFVLVGSLLVVADVGKNLADETRIASEFKTLSTESAKPQSTIKPTLSEEEMKRWMERLETHSDI
jgi:hypothetical protein